MIAGSLHLFFDSSVIRFAAMFVIATCSMCAVVDTAELESLLLTAVTDALAAAHIELKAAADIMRIDYGQLYRQLRGEPHQHLSLTRLFRLPFTFWLAFTPALISLVYRKRLQEVQQSIAELTRRV